MARRNGPAFRAAPLRVRVPATSANLGPGFDSLGLALGLYDEVIVRITDEPGLDIDIAGEGATTVARNARNLVVKSMRAAFKALGGEPTGLQLVCANHIPHGRGLGSSAAAIVAGITAARGLVVGGSERLDDDAVLELAASLEGHPDNVAACLRGGLTIAWTTATGARALSVPVSAELAPVVLVPGTSSSTKATRRLLPETVPHRDAVHAASRSALLVEALRTRPDLLLTATEDRLHQPYRAAAMPRTATVMGELREAGVPAVVSGAGPTVLALTTAENRDVATSFSRRGWTVMALEVDRDGVQAGAL
jgi:homoserine kinase